MTEARPNFVALPRSGFEHVEAWVFDLDNTLYPAECNLFAEIDTRMGEFISERFGVSRDEAQRIRKHYYYEYGTTLAGLMRLHDVPPAAFLDYVHDIDLSVIAPAPELAAALDSLEGRKFILTNGSSQHAERVIERLGLQGHFAAIFDIHSADFVPKPEPVCYERFLAAHRVEAREAAMFDDLPHNLETAHRLGMTTVLVACGPIDHPEHRAIAGWAELPPHIHHCTNTLADFLADIGRNRREEAVESNPDVTESAA
jgi:putative hydrolase of the HAD superfamily